MPLVAEVLGKASSLYLNAEGEKSIYFLGDTIWIDEVERDLKTWQPDVVVVNAGKNWFAASINIDREDYHTAAELLHKDFVFYFQVYLQ